MLEKYKNSQPYAYELLYNAIKNNKISHAYLFDTNDNSDSNDIIMSFVKDIMCQNIDADVDIICNRIDNGNYVDLKIINPDGLMIKKEQMEELQEEFNMVSFEGNYKIYVINECEKMNIQAANSILKFLEEPVDNIIAILVTNNINKVLKTIISRCQLVTLIKDSKISLGKDTFECLSYLFSNSENERKEFLEDERNNVLYNAVIEFISFYESNGVDTIIYIKKMWHDKFKDRVDNLYAFDIMINFYYDVLKYKLNGQVKVFISNMELVKRLSVNDVNDIARKIELLINLRNLLVSNLNINLLVDYVVLNLESR